VKPIKTVLGVYILTILLLVALPLNTSSELNNITIFQLRGDYFFHIMLFMPWAFFRQACKIKTLPWLLLGLLFAAGTEGLQYFLPWRAFNVNDLLANMIGVILGASLNLFFKQLLSHKSKVQL
jgi:glycopeptide antibiotics resistance protein